MGPLVMLLPFIEEQSVFAKLNLKIYTDDEEKFFGENYDAFIAQVPSFLCPAAEYDRNAVADQRGIPSDETIIWGATHYLGNQGSWWDTVNTNNGIFFEISNVTPKKIHDGFSNTAAFSERTGAESDLAPSSPLWDYFVFDQTPTQPELEERSKTVYSARAYKGA